MKILWLGNVILPEASEYLKIKKTVVGGWIEGQSEGLKQLNEDIELAYCFLYDNLSQDYQIIYGCKNIYYAIKRHKGPVSYAIKHYVNIFNKILNEYNPNIIHIWGSEYIHSYAMYLAAEQNHLADSVVLSIQGLVSECTKYYDIGIPIWVKYRKRMRDLIRDSSIIGGMREFNKNSIYEKKLLMSINNVIGRTEWDYACCNQYNPKVNYYKCYEILRNTFYDATLWNYDICEKHTIFISQALYPIKGFHYFVQALKIIKDTYPDVHVYVSGKNIINDKTIKDRLIMTSYGKYIKRELKKYNLLEYVSFIGQINAEEMVNQYRRANVFVVSSLIENSPNSLGEAMLIGTPCVSSYVGGIPSMADENEVRFYPATDSVLLAKVICEFFGNKDMCKKFSINGHKRGIKNHSAEQSTKMLMYTYDNILSRKGSNNKDYD